MSGAFYHSTHRPDQISVVWAVHHPNFSTAQIRISDLSGAFCIFTHRPDSYFHSGRCLQHFSQAVRPKHRLRLVQTPPPASHHHSQANRSSAEPPPRSVAVSHEVATSGKPLQALVELRLAARSISSRKAGDACEATATWREAGRLRGAVARGTCKAPSTSDRLSDQVA
jgi:hypothetical protein